MNFLAEEFFKFKLLTVFNEGAIFQWKKKGLLKIHNEKSAALKTKLLTKNLMKNIVLPSQSKTGENEPDFWKIFTQ